MNERIKGIMRGRPVHERLLVALAAAAVQGVHGDEALSAIVDEVQPSGADYSATVAGKPLHFFLGKTHAQIKQQAGENADEVIKALEERGAEIPDLLHTRTAFEETEDRAQRGVRVPSAPNPESEFAQGPALGQFSASVERTFGDEQIPASELWGMSDEELADTPGISASSIREIRMLQAQHEEQAASGNAAAILASQGFAAGQVQPPARDARGLPIGPQAGIEQREQMARTDPRAVTTPVYSQARQAVAEATQKRSSEDVDNLQKQGAPSRSASQPPAEQQEQGEQARQAEADAQQAKGK